MEISFLERPSNKRKRLCRKNVFVGLWNEVTLRLELYTKIKTINLQSNTSNIRRGISKLSEEKLTRCESKHK